MLSTGDFLYITMLAKKVVIFTYFLFEYVSTSGHVLGFNQCKDTGNQSRKLKSHYGARNQFQELSLELSSQAI